MHEVVVAFLIEIFRAWSRTHGGGVRYYWIVDPQLRTLEIYERGEDGRYVRALSAASGRLDVVPGCVGLVVDLGRLWAELDELEASE